MAQDPDPRDEVGQDRDGGEINDPLTQSDEEAPRKEFEPRKPQ